MSKHDGRSRISVVMATYNGSRYLKEQLESLADQSLAPLELIVSDDGSDDSTMHIVEQFVPSAPFPVKSWANPKRLGYGENFLAACGAATGEWIAFCDQDDIWAHNKLEIAQQELLASGAGMFVHTADLISPTGNMLGYFSQGIRRQRMRMPGETKPWGVYYGFTIVFRRDLLNAIDWQKRGAHTFEHNKPLSHDLWLYFLTTTLSRVLEYPKPLAQYRQHDDNQTPHMHGAVFKRWTTSLGTAVDPQLRRDEIAQNRAALLADFAQSTTEGDLKQIALRGELRWRQIARAEQWRVATYEGASLVPRLQTLLRSVTAGTYRSTGTGGLGAKLALKDLLAGVIGARRTKRWFLF